MKGRWRGSCTAADVIASHVFEQVRSALLLVGTISIVIDEDGTSVETEEFFQTLEDGTVLLVLTKGQIWRPAKVSTAS